MVELDRVVKHEQRPSIVVVVVVVVEAGAVAAAAVAVGTAAERDQRDDPTTR